MKSDKINISSVHYQVAASVEFNLIEDINIMDRGFCSVNAFWKSSLQIQQGMHLYSRLGGSESCPPKDSNIKVNIGGINGINSAFEINMQLIGSAVHGFGSFDQFKCKLPESAPVSTSFALDIVDL